MADKQISELTSASAMTDGSLFVIEQGGAAKSANWGMIKNYISPGVAKQYSPSSTYIVGEYVIHDNQLYRCKTAITTPESWTAAHWTAAVLGNDVGDLKSAMNTRVPLTATGTAQPFSGDFDNLTDNQIIGFTNTNNATHSPVNGIGGTLVVLRGRTGYDVTAIQLFIAQSGIALYYRILWGDGWSDWKSLIDVTTIIPNRVPITATGTAQAFSGDFNDLTDNQIIGFTNTTGATHSPVNSIGGTLVVLRGRTGYDVTAIQLFIDQTGTALYYRILWGLGWSAWKNVQNDSMPNEDYYSSISQFQKIGVIGDSYASGWVYPGGQGQNNYQLSWGQNIARRNGITCINISSGGLTTKSWLTHERGLAYLNSNPAQNLYFVCLGLNDQGAINAGTYTLGNSTDFANQTDTFYGNYSKIIDAIKTKAPNAKIVLCTVSEGDKTTFKQVSDAIVEIGTLASLPVIDITDDPFTTSSFFQNSMVASHPTAASYSGYAMMIERMFSKCCVENYTYFMDYYGD